MDAWNFKSYQLKHLDCSASFIGPRLSLDCAVAAIRAAGRNPVPIIVQNGATFSKDLRSTVIGNFLAYHASVAAGLETVGCFVVPDTKSAARAVALMTQEGPPSIDLRTANEKEIREALQFASQHGYLRRINTAQIASAAERIAALNRRSLRSLAPLKKMKIGIGEKGIRLLAPILRLD